MQSLDLGGVPVARRPFCDGLHPDDVRAGLGGPVRGTAHYVPGQKASLGPGLRDVAHEYDCTFHGARGEARAWVFAAPVRRPLAASISDTARNRPGVTTDCRAAGGAGRTVASRGLFGEAWLTCQLTHLARRRARRRTTGGAVVRDGGHHRRRTPVTGPDARWGD